MFWRKTRKAKNRQYLRRDAVDAHSSVGPFSTQSLSQFDHTGLGCVVRKLLLRMGDWTVKGGKKMSY